MIFGEQNDALRLVDQVLMEAASGRGAVLMVTGATGAGKTKVFRTAVELTVRRGGAGFAVAASAGERTHPFGLGDQLARAVGAEGLVEDGSLRDPRIAFRRLHQAIQEAARSRPVLIGIDDIHFADEESLAFLGYLVRQIAGARVAIVVTGTSSYEREQVVLHAEMLHLPYCHRLALTPLTRDGVAEMLSDRLGAAPKESVIDFCVEVTGGVPLLVEALVEDDVRPGDSFRQAVLRSLLRCEPRVAEVARSMALLDGYAAPLLIAEFLGADVPLVQALIAELRAMGLLAGGRFRHERTRAAVLASIPPERLPVLHRRAAEVLWRGGAPATMVADQLTGATGASPAAWSGPVLREAANEAVAVGDLTGAAKYLRHAVATGADEAERIRAAVLLADVQWHADPSRAVRHLDGLLRDARAGRLLGQDTLVLLHQMLWWGRFSEADELFRIAAAEYGWRVDDGTRAPGAAETSVSLLWMVTGSEGSGSGLVYPSQAWSGPMMAVLYLNRAATQVGGGPEVEQVHQTMRGIRAGSTVTPALYALVLLVCNGRHAEAARWADLLLQEKWIRRVPMRRAMFDVVKVVAAARRGDHEAALSGATAVLDTIVPASWGVAVGLPLGLAVRAATELGDYATAWSHLTFPVPPEMFDTPFALPYLQALGHYHQAMNDPNTARKHFQLGAELMARWRPGGPGDVRMRPTWVAAGSSSPQLDDRGPRGRGRAGLQASPEHRQRAVIVGDRPVPAAGLTVAESRVAALAAAGDSNRQIAGKLSITVSTVEQHLTKAYRKLNVHNRSDLSASLRRFGVFKP